MFYHSKNLIQSYASQQTLKTRYILNDLVLGLAVGTLLFH